MKFFNIIFFMGLLGAASAQDKVELTDMINAFVRQPGLESASISLAVFAVENNSQVIGYRADKALTPASSLKLLTCLTAMEELGTSFRYQTTVGYTGIVTEDGTLDGNLYIISSGDPTLGSARFSGKGMMENVMGEIVQSLRKANINCISGDIIIDLSAFDTQPVPPDWHWADLGNYYACGAWSLNINENLYHLSFDNRSRQGLRPSIESIYPEVPGLKLSNELTVAGPGSGDQAYIYGAPFQFNRRVIGTIPSGNGIFTIKGSLPDPVDFFLFHLGRQLTEQNIQYNGTKKIYKQHNRNVSILKRFFSPRLEEICRVTLSESLNLHAECLLKTMVNREARPASRKAGLAQIAAQLQSAGVSSSEFRLRDGSGLSSRNLISARAMCLFLNRMARLAGSEDIIDILPRGGYDGTVSWMFANSPARGKVWLKSGSMSGIQSYSGYIRSSDGSLHSFAVIVNAYSGKGSIVRKHIETFIAELYTVL